MNYPLRVDDILIDSHDCSVDYSGTADALIDAWLILPQWVPPAPKRVAASYDHSGGWWSSYVDDDEDDWSRRPPHVEAWRLTRRAGGVFTMSIWARYWRLFLGGPVDPGAGLRAADWHRRMVRARRDTGFGQFLIASTASRAA